MNSNNLTETLDILKDKLNNCSSFVDNIINNYNETITLSNLKLLSNISSNINMIETELEEFYYIMIDNNTNLNAEEKQKIKEIKINNKIRDAFLPYMMYMKILLENN
jgi:hypothetical protein